MHQRFRLEILGEQFCAGMSPLKNIVKKDPLGTKMPKNDATVKVSAIVISITSEMFITRQDSIVKNFHHFYESHFGIF